MVSFRGTYWLCSAYFVLLRVCRFFLFRSFFLLFCGVHYFLRYGGKFNNTYNKAAALKITAGQRSLTVVIGFVTAEKLYSTVTMTANTWM